MDEIRQILDGPGYFLCERTNCKLKIETCVQRRRANRVRAAFEPILFPMCDGCDQGFENERVLDVVKEKGKPKRGKGERNHECPLYDDCLELVVRRGWKSFNCEGCPMTGEKEKPANTRVCGLCGERPTIQPSSPYCSSCLAQKSKEKRVKKAGSGAKKKANSKGRAKPKSRSHVAISSPDKAEKPSSCGETVIMLNFAEHPELLKKIHEAARKDFRPSEMEIFWILDKFFSQDPK